MNFRLVRVLIAKDLSLYFRNRFFAMITALALVFYILIYFLMPQTADETLNIGYYTSATLPVFENLNEEGLQLIEVDTEDTLRQGVTEGNYVAGVVFGGDILEQFKSGNSPVVTIYSASDTPDEIIDVVNLLVRELVYQQAGQALEINETQMIVGDDLSGAQIPPRDRMRPLLVVLLVVFETMGMATLIAEERERRTLQALLVTPVSAVDLFIAKGISGITLALGQAVPFMAIIGGMNREPLLVFVALLLGAVMVTGISFIIGSLSRDMLGVFAWGLPVMIILFIPAIGIVLPGSVTGWVKVIPTYYMIDSVHRASNFGSSWPDLVNDLVILVGFVAVISSLGIWTLGRRTQ